jgi:hypothetical protein
MSIEGESGRGNKNQSNGTGTRYRQWDRAEQGEVVVDESRMSIEGESGRGNKNQSNGTGTRYTYRQWEKDNPAYCI